MDSMFRPVATLESDKPEEVHAYLTKLLNANLDANTPGRITSSQETWITVLSGITNFMFLELPGKTWATIAQKVDMLENSMEVIQRASARVEGLFIRAGHLAHLILTRLLDLGCIFGAWDAQEESPIDEVHTPRYMREKAFQVIMVVVRALGDAISTTAVEQPMWEVLRMFLIETLNTINDLASQPTSLPITVSFLKNIYTPEKIKNGIPFDIVLATPPMLHTFMIYGLEIITQSLGFPFLSHLFLADMVRTVPETTRRVFDFCLSPACPASPAVRNRLLTQVITNAIPLYQQYTGLCGPLRVMPYRLLQFRLEQAQKMNSGHAEIPNAQPVIPSTKADIMSAVEILRTLTADEARTLLIAYLRNNIPFFDKETLSAVRDAFLATSLELEYTGLLAELENREQELKLRDRNDVVAHSISSIPLWRQKVQTITQEMLVSDQIDWPEEDVTVEEFAQFALHHIQIHFERSLPVIGSTLRISLANCLGELICFLTSCKGAKCPDTTDEKGLATHSPSIAIVVYLLNGPEIEVTSEVRRRTYAALTRAIRHHSWKQGCDGLERVVEIVFCGTTDKDRSARLSAGNALGALIHMYSKSGRDVEPIFNRLYTHFDDSKLGAKETLIISVGLMGRIMDPEIVAQALCFLIAQLGSQYPPLKGAAYMKIDIIKQTHSKSLYSLLGHHVDRVAPFLVSRYCTQPALIIEACRLMAMTTSAFISMTRAKTYPQLFEKSEVRVLQKIARELEQPLPQLYLDNAAPVLAHVFQLQGPGQTKKALEFIQSIVTGNLAEGASVTIQQLVKMCLVPLLAELVAQMGYEHKRDIAINALKKVERITSMSDSGRALPALELGVFLKQHALGLISHLSDTLQDVTNKASLQLKRAILRSTGVLVAQVGRAISNIAPQYMSTFQTMVLIPELAEVTLESWRTFLVTLEPQEIGPYIGPTTAAFVSSWSTFSPTAQELAAQSLSYIIVDIGSQLGKYLDDVVDLSAVPELHHLYHRLRDIRSTWTPRAHLQRILDRSSSDNLAVAVLTLGELKTFMLTEHKYIRELASGDMFDPMIGQVMTALLTAACRDGEGAEALRLFAFEGIGVLGALDPDRFEISVNDTNMIVLNNFSDEEEAIMFTIHLIRDLLIGVFRATSDVDYQRRLGYALQQLLKVCQFTPSLIAVGNSGSIPIKVRKRWNNLPNHVVETLSCLLDAKYSVSTPQETYLQHPIYPSQSTYREWIQLWTCFLITKASGSTAQGIFRPFIPTVRNKDVVVAYHILPHLVLNILISGHEEDVETIRVELLTILEDQVNPNSDSATDKKLLSAQAVFMIMDHLNKWVRLVRQDVGTKKTESKRSRANQISSNSEEQLLRVDSILSSIDQNLMARAALQCKAYARSLMNFEGQIVALRERSPNSQSLPGYYERLHEIYSHLDEPDGMEGVSTLILSPSLEHQIRQHESTGRWTSAQSCWEVRLQQSPDNLDFHLGLLRCLRNLGHYDTLRTHVRGVLIRNPEWESALAGFQVESAWMVGAWDDVQTMVERTKAQTAPIVMARLLLAMQAGDSKRICESMSVARSVLGAPITAAGVRGYRRSYEAVLDLHLTYELELIQNTFTDLPTVSQGQSQQSWQSLAYLSHTMASRFESTLPTFRTREPILSLRRTAFSLSSVPRHILIRELGRSWLASSKIARKAGHWQTAYSALLQAKQVKARFSFMESAKVVKIMGEPLRAVQELENSMQLLGMLDDAPKTSGLTVDDEEMKDMKAKAQVLQARWMNESGRYDVNFIFKIFHNAAELRPSWESCHFHLGQFHDECFKALPPAEQVTRGMKMNFYTVRSFAKAMRHGSKYVYQTVPRLLTIWLDLGEGQTSAASDVFKKLNDLVARAIKETPVYKWFTAFPQIVSRVGHTNPDVYKHLSKLIAKVMEEYPKQALWLFTSVVKSTKSNREQRGKIILDQLRSNPNNAGTNITVLIEQCISMTDELLNLCHHPIDDDSRKTLTIKDFPHLARLGHSQLIIPLQESLTASLPPTSESESTHQPFPPNAPTFEKFFDEIEVMRSLAKPRKITIQGSNGQVYMFLGKPKDDLRKDARLMDFNAIINKLLKANSESRRRQLHIRTYGVVTLNEECGFIQWVPNTVPIRPVLVKGYDARRIRSWTSEMNDIFRKIRDAKDKDAAELFLRKILPMFPPVFHDWFVETFPEPTAWLAARLSYGRTAAVMSMVGFILGLGDRHCENILLDNNTGDAIHVDFNCLFEKGKTLETPERVPFRLTQNMIDGLGVTGVEGKKPSGMDYTFNASAQLRVLLNTIGVFRIACEVTMKLLRDHMDSLMSVLDAFIHDPLVEWEDEKRKLEREPSRRNQVKASVDLRMLARGALNPIEKKLKGIYSTSKERQEKEITTSNLVQILIQEATDPANLAKMYPGWAAWH